MRTTPTIQPMATDNPLVHAFRITATVTADDTEAMARHMNAAFDASGDAKVSMLLIFDAFEGREAGTGLRAETLKSQFAALAHVEKYAVVGAPDAADTMIAAMDKISPVDARTFDAADEPAAWAWVGARPV